MQKENKILNLNKYFTTKIKLIKTFKISYEIIY